METIQTSQPSPAKQLLHFLEPAFPSKSLISQGRPSKPSSQASQANLTRSVEHPSHSKSFSFTSMTIPSSQPAKTSYPTPALP